MQGGIGRGDPADRIIEVIEAFLLDAISDLGGDGSKRPLFFHDDEPVGLFHAFQDGHPIQRANGAQVDHFGADPFFLQFGGGPQRYLHHFIVRNDRDIFSLSFDIGLAQFNVIFLLGNF